MIFMDTALLFTCQSILVTGVTTPESCASFVSFGLYRSGRLHKSGVPSGSCEPPWPEFSLQKIMINAKFAEFTWSSSDLQICVIAVSLLKAFFCGTVYFLDQTVWDFVNGVIKN